MTALSAWASGSLAPNFTWTPAFGVNDLNSLAPLASVMSTIAFDNTAALDQFIDLSFMGAYVSAQTIVSGAGVSFSLATLQLDGVTYGDGRLTAGAQLAAYQPLTDPLGGTPIPPGTITLLTSDFGYAPLRPVKFRLVATNYAQFVLAASGNMASINTYKQNLNA